MEHLKATPGPWLVEKIKEGVWGITDGQTWIARVPCDLVNYVLQAGTPKANAHLIAASPDLLAELKLAKETFAMMPAPGNWAVMVEARIVAIEKLITKATGRRTP